MKEPLTPDQARRLILQCLKDGRVAYAEHGDKRMKERGVDILDCHLALRGGVVEPGERERGTWRYRVRGAATTVVVAFRLGATPRTVIVTAWENRRKR